MEEKGNIGLQIDEKSNEVVGLTVIEFMKTFGKKHSPIKIDVLDMLKSMKSC